jgi:hypothetical protein
MVHTLLVKKKLPQSQQICQNKLVQTDKVVFLMPIQIGYFKIRFTSKKN